MYLSSRAFDVFKQGDMPFVHDGQPQRFLSG